MNLQGVHITSGAAGVTIHTPNRQLSWAEVKLLAHRLNAMAQEHNADRHAPPAPFKDDEFDVL